jgi:hypothetical protein
MGSGKNSGRDNFNNPTRVPQNPTNEVVIEGQEAGKMGSNFSSVLDEDVIPNEGLEDGVNDLEGNDPENREGDDSINISDDLSDTLAGDRFNGAGNRSDGSMGAYAQGRDPAELIDEGPDAGQFGSGQEDASTDIEDDE